MSCFVLRIFRGIWYSNVNRECFGDFCMTINHLGCSKGRTSLLRLLNGDDQWKSWSQQNRNLLGILSSGEQDDNPPQRITINIKYNEGTGGKFMANIAEIVQPNTLNFFRKGQNKNSVGHSISDAFWQKIENKITMQDDRPYDDLKPSQRYYRESSLHHAVLKTRS